MSPKITRNCLRNVAKAQILLRQLFLPRYTCGLQRQLQDLVDVLQKHPDILPKNGVCQQEKMIKMEPFLGPKVFLPRKKNGSASVIVPFLSHVFPSTCPLPRGPDRWTWWFFPCAERASCPGNPRGTVDVRDESWCPVVKLASSWWT